MMHRSAQRLLYEYLREELDPVQRAQVEQHVTSCDRCAEELRGLRSAFGSIPPQMYDASRERREEFWNTFASRVEDRIRREGVKNNRQKPVPRWQTLFPVFSTHPRLIPALGGVLAVVVTAVLAWELRTPVQPDAEQAAILQPILGQSSDQQADYFGKSKVLLVGLANLKTSESEPLDLSVERQRSEELLQAVQAIPRDSLDTYSAMVAADLEKVLAEVAGVQSMREHQGVEMVRQAIRQQNLIFKLRMIENMHTPPRIVRTRDGDR